MVLVNKKDIPVGISKPGNYSLTDLNKIYQDVGNSNLTEEFFNYIAQNMINEQKKTRRSGGVYRAVGNILKLPFDEAIFVKDEIIFEWNNPNLRSYYLKIYDTENWEQKLNLKTSDSTYTLKFDPTVYIPGRVYAWTVYHGEDHPEQGTVLRTFSFADQNLKANFYNFINEIRRNNNPEIAKIKITRLYIDYNIYPFEE